jgi:copper(I)-binding protein
VHGFWAEQTAAIVERHENTFCSIGVVTFTRTTPSLIQLTKETMKHLTRISLLAASLFLSSHVVAQSIAITNSWVRATVQGQKATGAFMTVTSKENAKLVAVSSPVAGIVEIHEMKMDKDVMKMAALPNGLDLPAGKAVDLKPGGYHIMLMDLKLSLTKDVAVPLTLTFQDSGGKKSQQVVQVPVSVQPPSGQSMNHQQGDHKH